MSHSIENFEDNCWKNQKQEEPTCGRESEESRDGLRNGCFSLYASLHRSNLTLHMQKYFTWLLLSLCPLRQPLPIHDCLPELSGFLHLQNTVSSLRLPVPHSRTLGLRNKVAQPSIVPFSGHWPLPDGRGTGGKVLSPQLA